MNTEDIVQDPQVPTEPSTTPDSGLLDILNQARSKGASADQLQGIIDLYKKKNPTSSNQANRTNTQDSTTGTPDSNNGFAPSQNTNTPNIPGFEITNPLKSPVSFGDVVNSANANTPDNYLRKPNIVPTEKIDYSAFLPTSSPMPKTLSKPVSPYAINPLDRSKLKDARLLSKQEEYQIFGGEQKLQAIIQAQPVDTHKNEWGNIGVFLPQTVLGGLEKDLGQAAEFLIKKNPFQNQTDIGANEYLTNIAKGLEGYGEAHQQTAQDNSLPNTTGGKVASMATGFVPDLIELATTPELDIAKIGKLGEVLSKYGRKFAPFATKAIGMAGGKFPILMGTKGLTSGYSEAKDQGQSDYDATNSGLIKSAQEYGKGLLFEAAGAAAGKVSSIGAKALEDAGWLKGGQIVKGAQKAILNSTAQATAFSTVPFITNSLEGKPTTMDDVTSNAVFGGLMGLFHGAPKGENGMTAADGAAKETLERSPLVDAYSFLNADPEAIKFAYYNDATPTDLQIIAATHAQDAFKQDNLELKQQSIVQAGIYSRLSSVKTMANAAMADPNSLIKAVNELPAITDEDKQLIVNKINDIHNQISQEQNQQNTDRQQNMLNSLHQYSASNNPDVPTMLQLATAAKTNNPDFADITGVDSKGINNLINTPTDQIADLNNSEPDENNIAQKNIKNITKAVINNPKEFLSNVFQSNLPVDQKVDLMGKVNFINKNFNPIEIHKQVINNQIRELNAQVKLIDDHQEAIPESQQTDSQKAQAFTIKDNLVQERTKLGLDLQDIAQAQTTGQASSQAMKIIEQNRQAELDKVGPLTHNVIENTNDGTHDVIANGDIISQHPTPEDAQQRATDLNRSQIKKISDINEKYNQQQAPFINAINTGLIDAPTGKTVADAIPKIDKQPDNIIKVNTEAGKATIERTGDNELTITGDDGKPEKWGIDDAVNTLNIKPEDIQKIVPEYEQRLDTQISPSGTEPQSKQPEGEGVGGEGDNIRGEAAAQQNEEPVINEESAAKTAGEKEPVTFKTSKGSSYELHDDGTTTRDKAARNEPGHEGQEGPQERSAKTYFVTPEQAGILGEVQNSHAEKRRIEELPDGRIGIKYLTGKDAAKFEGRTVIKPETEPKEGLHPLEIYNDGKEHFGNVITEVNKGNAKPEIPEAETVNTQDHGKIETNETTEGRQEGNVLNDKAQEPEPVLEPTVKATGEALDVPTLKDTPYQLAAAELPNGKHGVFETNSGKLISKLYDTRQKLLDNFENNKDKLTPEAIASKVAVKNATDNIRSLKIKGRAYESTLGLPIYAWNNTLELIARSIEGGAKLVDAIKLGVNHIKQNYSVKSKNDQEIEDAVRNALLQKPTRNEGEGFHEYARRIGEWKKSISSTEGLSNAYKREYTKAAKPETMFNNRVKAGVELLKKNIAIPIDEYNRQLGVPETDTDHYVAAIKELEKGDSIKKINASKIMQQFSEKDPKKYIDTEARLLNRQLTAEEKAAKLGYKTAKEEDKQAFMEYDAAQRAGFKDKIAETKAKYEQKLEATNKARIEQKEKLTSTYRNIRSDINDILEGLNKSKLLAGVEYSHADLLNFAKRLNGVITEKGIDGFRDYIKKAVDNADYQRNINESEGLIKQGKNLLKQDYVPGNIKQLLKDIVTLNPNRVEDPAKLKQILDDVTKSQRDGEVPQYTAAELADYAQKQRDFDLQTRRGELLDKHQDITSQTEFKALADNGNTNFIHKETLADLTAKINRDPETTHNEKVKRLNNVDETLNDYRRELNDSVDENGNITGTPQDFQDALERNKPGAEVEPTENKRDALENIATAKQDLIDPNEQGLSPEQKASLKILQDVPLKGQDANTLRQFNNIVENVIANDDHSGMTIMEAKAIGNGDEGAMKPIHYLLDTVYKIPRSVLAGNRLSQKLLDWRMSAANLNILLAHWSNNDVGYTVATNTGTHFAQTMNGLTKAEDRMNELVGIPQREVFKKYKDVARNPESQYKTQLFSFINQSRELASDEQKDKELQKRLTTVNKDIELKTRSSSMRRDQLEGELEKKIWDGFAEKIKEKTGLDIRDKQELKGIKFNDIKGIEFLKEGERAMYDTMRNADQTLQPEHEKVANGINKPYEKWDNHMRDGYRSLGSGTIDVVGTDNVGFQATDNNVDTGSDTIQQRVKGDTLAQKAGEKQRVLNLNFMEVQKQNIRNMLFDIHTLKERMIFDEAMKNKDLVDAMGADNHQFYKQAAINYILNDMGMTKGLNEDGLRLAKAALNIIPTIGTYKGLLSFSQWPKQWLSTIGNMIGYQAKFGEKLGSGKFNIGKTMFGDAAPVMKTPDVQGLIKQFPISRRAENLAGLNRLSNEGISHINHILIGEGKPDKSVSTSQWKFVKDYTNYLINTGTVKTEDLINRYINKISKSGTKGEAWMAAPIRAGDINSANLAWVTSYAQYLMGKGIATDFKSIDWKKENEHPNIEAAAYAEHITSKQLNENTKAGRSQLLQGNDFGSLVMKNLVLPFASFGIEKGQSMMEAFRTMSNSLEKNEKGEYIYKDNTTEAARMLASNFNEELFYRAAKMGIKLTIPFALNYLLMNTIDRLWGTDDDLKKDMEANDLAQANRLNDLFFKYRSDVIGNYIFNAMPNPMQQESQHLINELSKMAINKDVFYEPKISSNSLVNKMSGWGGMFSAAFNENDRSRDLYRLFDNTNNYHVPVDISGRQKAIIGVDALTDILSFGGIVDADARNVVENARRQVDNELSKKFGDPYYSDENQQKPLTIIDKKILLGEEHENYYKQQEAIWLKKFINSGIPEKQAAQQASEHAKKDLIQKYGYNTDTYLKEGTEIKKKK